MLTFESAAAIASGGLVGFLLGLLGGGGSVLAVPLLLYVVGIRDAHVAIGTSSVAVALNAAFNLVGHARAGNVKWPCAVTFAGAGIAGAWIGSILGKLVDGRTLLVLFALVMLAVAVSMALPRRSEGSAEVRLTRPIALRLVAIGLATGLLSGFFGIGGGFLIVPGIILGSGMSMLNAVGSSLFSVAVFGSVTAVNYAMSGFVDWGVAARFVAGGMVGGGADIFLAGRLATRRALLSRIFAAVVALVAFYMLARATVPA